MGEESFHEVINEGSRSFSAFRGQLVVWIWAVRECQNHDHLDSDDVTHRSGTNSWPWVCNTPHSPRPIPSVECQPSPPVSLQELHTCWAICRLLSLIHSGANFCAASVKYCPSFLFLLCKLISPCALLTSVPSSVLRIPCMGCSCHCPVALQSAPVVYRSIDRHSAAIRTPWSSVGRAATAKGEIACVLSLIPVAISSIPHLFSYILNDVSSTIQLASDSPYIEDITVYTSRQFEEPYLVCHGKRSKLGNFFGPLG